MTLFGGANWAFTTDRFCNLNSAVSFNKGYLQIPSGTYFSGDFTLNAWVSFPSYQSWARILDFGNVPSPSNNVLFAIMPSGIAINIYVGSNFGSELVSPISLNEWHFVSFVVYNTTGSIYVDGILKVTRVVTPPANVTRTNNYIGRSNWWPVDQDVIAKFDDIQIYSQALSSIQINSLYQSSNI